MDIQKIVIRIILFQFSIKCMRHLQSYVFINIFLKHTFYFAVKSLDTKGFIS